MVTKLGILLVSVLLVASATTCCLSQQTYYVKPDPNTPCETDLPCHTLDHYVANSTVYFRSNTTLVFLPGRFHLSQEVFISDLEGFALLGSTQYKNTSGMITGVPEPSTEIYCTGTGSGAFGFYNITNLYISNLVFTFCGYVGRSQIWLTPTPALYIINVRDLSVVGVVVQNSTKYGMLLYNTAGNVTIYGSTFMFNSGAEQDQWSNLGIAVDHNVGSCTEKDRDLNLTIQSSQILFGSNGIGLSLRLHSPCHKNMVAVTDVIFNGNVAPNVYGGNMYIETAMGVNTLNTVHIDGCYFTDAVALSGGGLVLYVKDEEGNGESTPTNTSHSVFISNSQFVSNQALTGGGGVAVQLNPSRHHARIHMRNVTFDSNICLSPECGGGAMNILSFSRSHSLHIEDSYISGGVADNGGGIALQYVESQNVQAVVVISNTTIVDNRASNDGGGIYIIFADLSPDIPQQMNHTLPCCDGVIHIKNVTFERNTCLPHEDVSGFGAGGAIAMFSNSSISTLLLIEDSYIADGAARGGGGIALFFIEEDSKGESTPTNTSHSVFISNSQFVSNQALFAGGGVVVQLNLSRHHASIHMKNVTFDSNICLSPEYGGGAIQLLSFSRSHSLLIEDSHISGGVADNGGGIALKYVKSQNVQAVVTVVISNTTIVDNRASNDGGGIYIFLDDLSPDNPQMNHTLLRYDVSVHIKNVTFERNTCLSPEDEGFGGAVAMFSNSSISTFLLIEDSYIADGAASGGGGIALFFIEEDSKGESTPTNTSHSVFISNSQFVTNQALNGGGGVAVQWNSSRQHVNVMASIHMKNVTFDSNICLSPEYSGGAIKLLSFSRSHSLLIEDSYISGGVAGYGGGIALLQYAESQNVQVMAMISNTTIVDNRASNDGGGIYIIFADLSPDIPQMNHTLSRCDGVIHIKNVTFERNTCLPPEDGYGIGGAIAMLSNSSISTLPVLIEDSYIADGAASSGGGIAAYYSNAQAIAVISNTIIEHNIASQVGGGMYCGIYSGSNVNLYIRNATAISNSAGNLGGGIHIDSASALKILSESIFNMNISHTLILDNTAMHGGGLSLRICNTREIDIVRTTFIRNHAGTGGNIYITDCVAAGTITLKDCRIQHGTAEWGAGIAYIIIKPLSSIPILSTCQPQKEEMLYVSRTHFLDNVSTLSADISIFIDMYQNAQDSLKIVRFERCTLNHSSSSTEDFCCPVVNVYGSVDPFPETYSTVEFLFEDTVFQGESGSAVVELKSLRKVTFSNCSFTDNNATAIMASSSNIFLEGSLLFKNNVGYDGGALTLFDNSMLYFYPNTHIQFVRNSAMHAGGGIYVDQAPFVMTATKSCFYQIKLSNTSLRFIDEDQLKMYNISIELVNNTATAAGSALYGGSVDNCRVFSSSYIANISEFVFNSSTYFNKLFIVTTPRSDYSPISSDPIGVCFCQDNKPDCENETLTNSTYSGALVATLAVVVGQRNGVVRDGIVIATYNGSDFTSKTFSSGSLCQDIELRVFSSPGLVNITFRPGGKENVRYFTRQLQVSVLPCPLGFELWEVTDTEKQYACDCITFLKDYGIRCTIDDQTFQRHPNVWIGTSCTNLSSDVCRVMAHNHCPFQYCKPQQTELTLNDTDSQCNLNHSGILCGGCRPGYSLILGTSRCLRCSNKFSSLLLVFLIAGLALVFLLMLCNMTVSDGTINGLIFYANIVGINSAAFFPTGQGNLVTSFLSVFIAWINLDLGIETCFYSRMDMYQKTWLQFVFPLYIWAIVLFLITTTHYSTLASKVLVRRNAVKVLATLILLSFAKLMHTTVATLSFTILEYPDGNNKAVWLYDGNIDYLTGKHIPLFVVALLVFVLLMLPYTVVLTFSQCIQRKSNHQLLSWYTKLRLQPLFDAYAGPYKDRYRFWSGLLVTVRIVLFLVFALNALGNPNTNLLAITTVTTILFGGTVGLSVFKKWPLTVLESFLLINLSMLSTSTLYVRSSGGSQAAVTGTLVGLAFALFIATLSYRAYQELKKNKLGVWVRNTCMRIPHFLSGWRCVSVEHQSQQGETGGADGQPVRRRAPVQHWEITLEDPESGEATLVPISSSTHPQTTQSHSPHDTSASACAREYSVEMYRRRYCPPESPTPSLSPSHYSDPLQLGVAHLGTDPAPTDPHPSDSTTSGHTGTDSHSNTTLYRAQVSAFIGSTSDDNPEYENYNELQTIQRHSGEDDLHPSHPNTTDYTEEASSSDYRDQIFEILAFDSSSHDHSRFEPENSNPVQVIHHNEDGDSDTSADEHQSLLKINHSWLCFIISLTCFNLPTFISTNIVVLLLIKYYNFILHVS